MSDFYDSAIDHFFQGDIDLENDDIIGICVDTADYIFDYEHEYLSSVPSEARIAGGTLGEKVSLENPVIASRAFSADPTTFPGVVGDDIDAIILAKRDTSTFENSLLIAYVDSSDGFPLTPLGGGVVVTWDTGTNKIFRISRTS